MPKLHADHYADAMVQTEAALDRNEQIAEGTYRIRVAAPAIARTVVPGQFVMIRLACCNAPLIGRALAVYDVLDGPSGKPEAIDLVYVRKGAFTTALADAPLGTRVSLWGPLGNGFATRACDRLILAAGGIGQTPMLLLGREALGAASYGDPPRESGWCRRVEIIYGARHASLLAGVEDFQRAGFDVTLCTDDGSAGERRLVPDALAHRLAKLPPGQRVRVATCGPEIMMEKVTDVCLGLGIDCQVSMETPMACGIGICFTCVAKVREAGSGEWDYKRTCVEGPVFDAGKICW